VAASCAVASRKLSCKSCSRFASWISRCWSCSACPAKRSPSSANSSQRCRYESACSARASAKAASQKWVAACVTGSGMAGAAANAPGSLIRAPSARNQVSRCGLTVLGEPRPIFLPDPFDGGSCAFQQQGVGGRPDVVFRNSRSHCRHSLVCRRLGVELVTIMEPYRDLFCFSVRYHTAYIIICMK